MPFVLFAIFHFLTVELGFSKQTYRVSVYKAAVELESFALTEVEKPSLLGLSFMYGMPPSQAESESSERSMGAFQTIYQHLFHILRK